MKNEKLKKAISQTAQKPRYAEAVKVAKPDTVNKQGHEAYKLDPFISLLSLLNTSKLEPQFYRNEIGTVADLKSLIKACCKLDLMLTAQCIVYSRCLGEGMRTINQAAAIFIAPYISGQSWAKDFYNSWDHKNSVGGVIYRPDDMYYILDAFIALNGKLSNAIKRGFKLALEKMPAYSLLKYKNNLIDVIRLVRPNPEKSPSVEIQVNSEERGQVSVIDAIMRAYPISADTHEVANSEAGQIVAKAKKEGLVDDTEAAELLKEAKAENWKALLTDDKLGIKAALLNIRNILLTDPNKSTVNLLCNKVSSSSAILKGKIMPYEIDIAHETILAEFNTPDSRDVCKALLMGYNSSIPNLKEIFTGNTCILLDVSGSMANRAIRLATQGCRTSCQSKANLIAATIALATNADIVVFGGQAKYHKYNPNLDVFSLATSLNMNMGSTNLSAAWKLIGEAKIKYDRVVILSDYECNSGSTYNSYTDYIKKVGSPYVYSIDLASYGTTQLVGDKVRYYYGYGFSMFNDIKSVEYNPNFHIEKVKLLKFK